MSKTKEELQELKKEYETLTTKLKELTEEELNVVTGGIEPEEHNIILTGDFKGNWADGSGGGVFNEGSF